MLAYKWGPALGPGLPAEVVRRVCGGAPVALNCLDLGVRTDHIGEERREQPDPAVEVDDRLPRLRAECLEQGVDEHLRRRNVRLPEAAGVDGEGVVPHLLHPGWRDT